MLSKLTKKFFSPHTELEAQKQAACDNQLSATGSPVAEAGPTETDSFQIEQDAILINQTATDRAEVLTVIANKMLEKGYVASDYKEALEAREQAVSTYLMNGIAIPHGVNEAKSLVRKTGIVIIQLPQGVLWNANGDRVYLAVGIAAAGNEHNEVLQKLTAVVMDEAQATHLGQQATVAEIAEALGQPLPSPVHETPALEFDVRVNCIVADAAGLHARPASALVKMAEAFPEAEVWIAKADHHVQINSMTKLLSLGAVQGETLTICAKGPEALRAAEQIAAAINQGLDELTDTAPASEYKPLDELIELRNPNARVILEGIPASPGIALADAFILDSGSSLNITKEGTGEAQEQAALQAALQQAGGQLQEVHAKLATISPAEAAIFQAQAELIKDTSLLEEAKQHLNTGVSAAWAWFQSIDAQASEMEANPTERIRARAADLRDVGNRVVNILQGAEVEIAWPNTHFVLIAKELTPSQTAQLSAKPVQAICTELGGATSHMAILARALGIPALVGLGADLLRITQHGEQVAVVPQSGQLIVSPDAATISQVEASVAKWHEVQRREFERKDKPAITQDGIEIEVVCNIASAEDAGKVTQNGGAGVGLLRTEFLFETATEEPSIEAQVNELSRIAKEIGSQTLIIRTSDIGGDKPVSWLQQPKEDNPFLGVRGIRLSLRHSEIFKRQLEAIYETAKRQVEELGKTGIHIMFPMISAVSEWREAKALAQEVRENLNAPDVPLGMMIEVPSAALLAEHFAKEVAFFSIGTNDLTQYTLAMDRMNPDLSHPLDNYNPALLQMIAMTTRAASAAGKWVGVCGNLVAEADLAKILIGLGVKELSVSPVNVPATKELVRSVSRQELSHIAERVLKAATPEEVKEIIRATTH